MALVLKDRIKETTTTSGTGTYTLAGAESGFEAFSQIGDGNTTYYCCTDGSDFEIGIGTYTLSGTTLARTTILQSSNSDSAVSWASGSTRTIFCTYSADKSVFLDASNQLVINGTSVTSTAAELNILDGVTATAAEINIMDGVTATTAELNIMDGVTSTTAELNILDGVTASASDINLIDGITNGTVAASKAVIVDSNKDISGFRNLSITGDLTVAGDDITMATNTAGNLLIADGTNFNSIAVGDLSEISTVANDDVFVAVDTSGGGLKKVSRSAIVSGLATSGAISNVVEDTTPQLGGDLDMNGQDIVTTSNADLELAPNGTGHVTIRGNTNQGTIQFNCENNSHGQQVKAAPHSESANNVLTLPSTGGDARLVSTASTATLTNKTLTSPKINEDVAVTSTATELNVLDGITAVVGELNALDLGSTAVGTAIASKAVILDSNKDYTGIRNFTITGEIDAATGDFSGAVDVAGATTTTTITASGIIKTDDTTDATSTTDGSLQTDGGLSVAKDAIIGDDLKLLSDSSILSLGAGSDATLTHDGTTGLTIAATPISIDSTGELHLNSTTGDIKLQDGGTDQIIFDLDGTAGAVIIKPATDSDDIIFQQYDGTAVMTVEDNVSLNINNDITVAGRASGHVTTDNDGSFDLSVGNDFKCTSAGNLTLTFTNAAAGQSGNIMFVNGGNHTISAHADLAINADVLTTISASGTYHLAYFCSAASGNDTILVSASAILT